MPTHIAVFITVVATLAVLPGTNNVVVTRQTMAGGRRVGLLTVARTSSGIVVWAILAATGLSAIVLATPHALAGLRVVGAVLLAVLGIHTLEQVRRGTPRRVNGVRGERAVLVGLGSSLGNPKAGVFSLALLPQFTSERGPVAISTVSLGLLWAAISGAWFCLYVLAVDRGRRAIGSQRGQTYLGVANGVALLGLAAAVAAGM